MPYQTLTVAMPNHSRLGRRPAVISPSHGPNSHIEAPPTQVIIGPSSACARCPTCGSSQVMPPSRSAVTMVASPTTSSVFHGSRMNRPATI
ncbi:Uncharacterised protein [Bordetella pertussis]|nr:Uncharacterised protein [Bordetella pertussis]CFT94920.1 Uncharacterised protein [Bordetella pertussis]CPO09992.1 Uncharacterised protein [Bordetella pertussis]